MQKGSRRTKKTIGKDGGKSVKNAGSADKQKGKNAENVRGSDGDINKYIRTARQYEEDNDNVRNGDHSDRGNLNTKHNATGCSNRRHQDQER